MGACRRMATVSCCSSKEPPIKATSCCGGASVAESRPDSTWFRVGISLALAGQGMVFGIGYYNALRAGDAPPYGSVAYWAIHGGLLLSVVVVLLLLGGPLIRNTWAALRERRITVESLFLLSAVGALIGSIVGSLSGDAAVYYEVIAVVLCIYTIGKRLGERSREQIQRAAAETQETFNFAFIRSCCGERRRVSVRDLKMGDEIEVLPGEAIAVDGTVTAGTGYVEETSVTGEPRPVVKGVGDRALAGSWSVDGVLSVRVEVAAGGRLLDGILASVQDAAQTPSVLETQARKVVVWFVPIVASVSALTFVGWLIFSAEPWWRALFHAMAVLLVACPCAVGLATPIAVWSGLQRLLAKGYIAKSGRLMDGLAGVKTVIFDKTGTLSVDRPAVVGEDWEAAAGVDRRWLESAIRAVEARFETHPVARALIEHLAEGDEALVGVEGLRVEPGRGVEGRVGGRLVRIGEASFAAGGEAQASDPGTSGSGAVFVSVDGALAVTYAVRESFRAGLPELARELKALGLRVLVLTGDPQPPEGLPAGWEVRSGLLPADKERIVSEEEATGQRVLFLGDGINDAAAMAQASGSIAMGSGSSLTRASADAVFLGSEFSSLPGAIALARRVRSRLRGNLLFAFQYNVIGMAVAAAGLLHPVIAALVMMVSSTFVSVRAIRSTQETKTGSKAEGPAARSSAADGATLHRQPVA